MTEDEVYLAGQTEPAERAYCEYRMSGHNKSSAFRLAYPDAKNPSASGYSLERKARVQAYLKGLQETTAKEFKITRDRLVQELAVHAFGDVTVFLEADGEGGYRVRGDLKKLPMSVRKSLVSVKQTMNGNGADINVRVTDKLKAIEQLAKMLGLNEPDKLQHAGRVDGVTVVLRGLQDGFTESESDEGDKSG